MRKLINILLVISLCTFAFCGCNTESKTDGTTALTISTEQSEPDNMKMVIGKIESIAGNQVTLALVNMSSIEMPSGRPEDMSFPEDMSMPEGMSRPEGGEPPEGFSMPDGEFPDFGGEPPEGMSMPEMENFPMPDGSLGTNGRGPQIDTENLTYTGETEKYIIPTGIKIGSGDYTSLSKGMVISLRLDDSNAVKGGSIISR